TVSVAWNTTSAAEGNYTLSAYAWPVPGEVDTTDNTFINGEVRITSIIHDVAVINVTPSANVVLAGESVNITTTVKNKGTETETFSVTTYYEDNTLETKPVTDLAPDAEEVTTFTWDTTGVAGGNYTIKATAELPGEVNVADNTFIDGDVRVEIHDIAVSSVTVSSETVEIGENITITVVVQNEGTETETFEVKAYRNATEIGTEDVISLAAEAQSTLTFIWDTTGLEAGDYVIKVVASTVPGEIDEADNTKTYGIVTLSSPSPEGLPVEIIVAGILVAIVILALVSYIVLKRRKPSQG
ncbi:MAG: CARDB domain-containing protein, partial [Promethearchaeota archaeon]